MEYVGHFVQILKEMYKDKDIEISKIKELLSNNKITKDEYLYIIKKENGVM